MHLMNGEPQEKITFLGIYRLLFFILSAGFLVTDISGMGWRRVKNESQKSNICDLHLTECIYDNSV